MLVSRVSSTTKYMFLCDVMAELQLQGSVLCDGSRTKFLYFVLCLVVLRPLPRSTAVSSETLSLDSSACCRGHTVETMTDEVQLASSFGVGVRKNTYFSFGFSIYALDVVAPAASRREKSTGRHRIKSRGVGTVSMVCLMLSRALGGCLKR